MHIDQLKKYKKILILGYGKEGKATEQYLKKYVPDSEIGISDKSDGADYLEKQMDYDLVVKTPGISKRQVKIPYTTATNIFFANKADNPVIGVTGSKGKSTTASLIFHILKQVGQPAKLVGNIGNPALGELIDPPEVETYFVFELSSYQLEDIEYSPHISVVVSLFPDHMNYHGSEKAYYAAKHHIISKATKEDFYIYNPDYPLLQQWTEGLVAQAIPFEKDFVPTDTQLQGEHNKSNICGAITVARLLNIPDEESAAAIKTFQPLPHRLQRVHEYKGITFYDDAISTTPESTIAALEAIPHVKTIFLGGEDRGYNYDLLAQKLKDVAVEAIVLFPTSGKTILSSIKRAFTTLPRILETDRMEDAVRFAYAHTPQGCVCILSTASPSYSIWKNFEEKGDQFQSFVLTLSHE